MMPSSIPAGLPTRSHENCVPFGWEISTWPFFASAFVTVRPDLRDVRRTGDEHIAGCLRDRLPLMAPDLCELRFRQGLHGPPVGVFVLEQQHRSRAGGPRLIDDLCRDRKSMVPTLDDNVLLRLNV